LSVLQLLWLDDGQDQKEGKGKPPRFTQAI